MASKRKQNDDSTGSSHVKDLEQVEAALLIDPENEDLLKLKADLEELIRLSEELTRKEKETVPTSDDYKEVDEQVVNWKVGDRCLARWSDSETQFYEATINQLSVANHTVEVTFRAYQNRTTLSLDDIKATTDHTKPVYLSENDKKKRAMLNNPTRREYIMKRKLKKQQKLDAVQSECEKQKDSWLKFRGKITKNKKNESIFATTDNVNGRVGIGTCGTSGRPMTEFVVADKMKKAKTSSTHPLK